MGKLDENTEVETYTDKVGKKLKERSEKKQIKAEEYDNYEKELKLTDKSRNPENFKNLGYIKRGLWHEIQDSRRASFLLRHRC